MFIESVFRFCIYGKDIIIKRQDKEYIHTYDIFSNEIYLLL